MAHISKDRIKESTTTTGTGSITLAGAVTGFRSFASVMATNDTCYYTIVHSIAGTWEIGLGTLTSATVLARTTIYASTNSGAAVNFASGSKEVFLTLAADRTPIITSSGLNIPSSTSYQINGTNVLSATSLGSGVVSSSLTTVGILSSLSVSGVITSSVTTGTSPLTINSTTLVSNLNSDLLDGQHGSYYLNQDNHTNISFAKHFLIMGA